MASFKERHYTEPVISNHNNELSKDWYEFFRFKHEGKIYRFKRREGINIIKTLRRRLRGSGELLTEIEFDLKHSCNPILDPKRERCYNQYLDFKNEKQASKNYQITIGERMKRYL